MANESLTDTVAKTGKNMGAAAADTFHDTGIAARKTANGLNALAEAVASDTKDGVRQLTHVVENESSKIVGFMRESIQERPNLTVGVAAGLGILLGLILSGRR
jgi:ElaB/YqjD/DUF883 family membrane-anchored ribosome-binding protein